MRGAVAGAVGGIAPLLSCIACPLPLLTLLSPRPRPPSPAAALGTDGQWERAEKVVEWMLRSDIKPNVRTYTALITGEGGLTSELTLVSACTRLRALRCSAAAAACKPASCPPQMRAPPAFPPSCFPPSPRPAALGNAKQWDRALGVVRRMRRHSFGGGLEPNAYTYSGAREGQRGSGARMAPGWLLWVCQLWLAGWHPVSPSLLPPCSPAQDDGRAGQVAAR